MFFFILRFISLEVLTSTIKIKVIFSTWPVAEGVREGGGKRIGSGESNPQAKLYEV